MASAAPLQILVVEDDFEIRESMRDLLEDAGYAVIAAENGSVALEYLRSAKDLPCMILLDISMPVMDGYAFRAEQMKDSRIAVIPTAMISADGHVRDKATRAGVEEYLRKPVELGALLALIEKYCPEGAR